MFIAAPPVNYWQCVVVDQQRNVLLSQSPSNFIALSELQARCQQDPVTCEPTMISCRFNGAVQTPTCTVRNDLGQRFTVQMNYQPCARAMANCQQQLNLNQQYNLHCYVVG